MFNYLCLLGWSPGNDLEKFDSELAIQKFDLNNVLPNSAIFDEKKLLWLNGLYIRSTEQKEFEKTAINQIEKDINRPFFSDELNRVSKILSSVQERIETLNDLTPQIIFLLDEPFVINSEDWDSVNSEEAQSYLESIREKFKVLTDFSIENIESIMRETIKELDIKTKIGFQATRVAITGTKISPPLFESIYSLGKETSIARLAETIEKL